MTQPLAGASNSVQEDEGTAQAAQNASFDNQSGLSSVMTQLMGQGPAVVGPNANAYDQLFDNSALNAQGYLAAANSYTQPGATISNPYQAQSQAQLANTQSNLNNVGGTLMATASGQGPAVQAAKDQMTQATDQSIQAQTAMARSATGGALAQNAAQLSGQQNTAQTLGQAASQTQINLANQEQAAAQAAGQVYGTAGQLTLGQYNTEQQTAEQQAQLQQQNQAQVNAQQLGLYGASQNEETNSLNSLNSYGQQSLAAQGLQMNSNQMAMSSGSQLLGTAATAAAGAAMMSDERLKDDVHDEGEEHRRSLADDFLARLHPASFRYRDEADEPGPSHGGRYLGVMAQDLQRSPGIGGQLVMATPRGLAVEPKATLSAALAGLGRLNERVAAMEKRNG